MQQQQVNGSTSRADSFCQKWRVEKEADQYGPWKQRICDSKFEADAVFCVFETLYPSAKVTEIDPQNRVALIRFGGNP